jgi:hypothetical protein
MTVRDMSNDESEGGSAIASETEPIVQTVVVGFAKGLIGTIPGASVVTEIINGLEKREDQKRQAVIALAVQAFGRDLAALQLRLENDVELADLWIRGLEAASKTRMKDKLRAFAAILAGSVKATQRQRTAASAIIRVLEEIEEEHLEILGCCEEAQHLPAPQLDDKTEGRPGASMAVLSGKLPHLGALVPILVSNLTSLSLIETRGLTPGPAC